MHKTNNMEKTLGNTTANDAAKNVKDIQFWGDGNTWKLLSKASSQEEGWMKSSKALEVAGIGCAVQVTTQQRNPDGSYAIAEAVTFIPSTHIEETKDDVGVVIGRKLVTNFPIPEGNSFGAKPPYL